MDTKAVFEKWMNRVTEKYRDRAPGSAKLYEKAQRYLPGGDTRTVTFFKPYPLFMARGEGFKLYDFDGNEYIDFLNNYTALIHGHSHPEIIRVVTEQLKKGVSFAGPTESQSRLAEIICERVKSVEQIRFCNTGTEATMNAIRAARIFSGKSKVVKTEGGYHGTHDLAEVSISPKLEDAGPISKPRSVPQSRGIPKSILKEVIVVPFNNKQATETIIRRHQEEIACVIVEPMIGSGGCIPQAEGYLEFLRDLTRKLRILLIFDEIVTFRLGTGGLQGVYGIEADLTTFGKIIGGGFPVGAFGGSGKIMKIFSPQEKGFVSHSGTFNGNPVTVEAGIVCLKELTPEAIGRINSLGNLLGRKADLAFEKNGIRGKTTGLGSLTHLHFNAETIRDYRSVSKGNFQAMLLVHMELLARGIYVAPRGGEIAISTPMTEKEVDVFITAFGDSLHEIRPFIEETTPELIQ